MSVTTSRLGRCFAVLMIGLTVSFSAIDLADARRAGGGFGSRGARTYQAPAPTKTAPTQAAPIERSMTQKPQANQQSATAPQAAGQRPGLFGGFGRSMIGGLLVGGLIGAMLGTGFGGAAGFLGMLLQIALIGGVIMLAMRFFARRQQPQMAGAGPLPRTAFEDRPTGQPSFRIPTIGSGASKPAAPVQAGEDIEIGQQDLDRFEELLSEVQTAYGNEDYATIRKLTTPEAMSYLAEELGENATNGVKNAVSDVKLLQGDVSEAWREGDAEYATLAMRYASIDAMVDRNTGDVVDGDDRNPTEITEVWTFVRKNRSDWKLSAIQAV